jgi:hypothetical protein
MFSRHISASARKSIIGLRGPTSRRQSSTGPASGESLLERAKNNVPVLALTVGVMGIACQLTLLYPWHPEISEEFTHTLVSYHAHLLASGCFVFFVLFRLRHPPSATVRAWASYGIDQ